jgi:hypothetical protein
LGTAQWKVSNPAVTTADALSARSRAQTHRRTVAFRVGAAPLSARSTLASLSLGSYLDAAVAHVAGNGIGNNRSTDHGGLPERAPNTAV